MAVVRYEVLMTSGAERDIEAIYDYIAQFDSPANADYVLDSLEEVLQTLATHPDRGSHPKELLSLGIREYRQVMFKPYRLIYRVLGRQVIIYTIADGRRDMQSLLTRRLLSN